MRECPGGRRGPEEPRLALMGGRQPPPGGPPPTGLRCGISLPCSGEAQHAPELPMPPAPRSMLSHLTASHKSQPDLGAPTRMGERAPTHVLWGQMGARETAPSRGHTGGDTTFPRDMSSSSSCPPSSPSPSPISC